MLRSIGLTNLKTSYLIQKFHNNVGTRLIQKPHSTIQ